MSKRASRTSAARLPNRLRAFVDMGRPKGGWLAILDGPKLRLVSAWRAAEQQGSTFEIHRNPLLLRLKRTRAPVVCNRDSADWASIPHPIGKADTYWACFPLLVGSDLVGAVGMWGSRPLKPALARQLRGLAKWLGPVIDAEAKLDHLASELEEAASAAQDSRKPPAVLRELRPLARHVLRGLSRALPEAGIRLVIADWRGRVFHEFGLVSGRLTSTRSAMAARLTDPSSPPGIANSARRKRHDVAQGAWTAIPLVAAGHPEGALLLSHAGSQSGSGYNDFILRRLVPPLAALVVHARESEARATQDRRLAVIAALSTELAGVTDTRQVVEAAAGKIAQLFEGALTRIVLSDGGTTALMAATAGSVGETSRAPVALDVAEVDKELSARVLATGERLLAEGSAAAKRLHLRSGRFVGSAVCVPIKDEERIVGTIEVRRESSRGLGDDDMGTIECLAAIVASAVAFARNRASAGEAAATASRRPQRIPEDRLIRAARLISVGEMAAGIAHELNNPLTTVTGFTELILDEMPPDAAYRADVEMVLQESRRARSVVRRLLDFARQGEGTRSRSDIGEIVEDVLGLTTHLMRTNGVRLDFVKAENLPWVFINTNQLKQVFLNLVHNALQAMPTGGKLAVTLELQNESGRDWVVTRIRDDGIGIRPGDMSRIFEPFFTTRAEHGGTGLGLSVSYGIVSEHGGRIDVESQPGHGSTFSVWLPV